MRRVDPQRSLIGTARNAGTSNFPAALYISERTAPTHVSHLLGELGLDGEAGCVSPDGAPEEFAQTRAG